MTPTETEGRLQMLKTALFAFVAACVLAGIGTWATSNIQAGIAGPTGVGIDPFQMMVSIKHLPSAHHDDFSVLFN
jgi:hypothetical protein